MDELYMAVQDWTESSLEALEEYKETSLKGNKSKDKFDELKYAYEELTAVEFSDFLPDEAILLGAKEREEIESILYGYKKGEK